MKLTSFRGGVTPYSLFGVRSAPLSRLRFLVTRQPREIGGFSSSFHGSSCPNFTGQAGIPCANVAPFPIVLPDPPSAGR